MLQQYLRCQTNVTRCRLELAYVANVAEQISHDSKLRYSGGRDGYSQWQFGLFIFESVHLHLSLHLKGVSVSKRQSAELIVLKWFSRWRCRIVSRVAIDEVFGRWCKLGISRILPSQKLTMVESHHIRSDAFSPLSKYLQRSSIGGNVLVSWMI